MSDLVNNSVTLNIGYIDPYYKIHHCTITQHASQKQKDIEYLQKHTTIMCDIGDCPKKITIYENNRSHLLSPYQCEEMRFMICDDCIKELNHRFIPIIND